MFPFHYGEPTLEESPDTRAKPHKVWSQGAVLMLCVFPIRGDLSDCLIVCFLIQFLDCRCDRAEGYMLCAILTFFASFWGAIM